jgi:hypothetical protein
MSRLDVEVELQNRSLKTLICLISDNWTNQASSARPLMQDGLFLLCWMCAALGCVFATEELAIIDQNASRYLGKLSMLRNAANRQIGESRR